jgi:hypothetical protein
MDEIAASVDVDRSFNDLHLFAFVDQMQPQFKPTWQPPRITTASPKRSTMYKPRAQHLLPVDARNFGSAPRTSAAMITSACCRRVFGFSFRIQSASIPAR